MKIVLFVLAGLLILVGAMWLLQGLNVWAGSAMSGQNLWVLIGSVVIAAGVVVGVFAARKKR